VNQRIAENVKMDTDKTPTENPEIIEQIMKFICPNCGYCPHCGRGNTTQPPHYLPYYPPYWGIGTPSWYVKSGTIFC